MIPRTTGLGSLTDPATGEGNADEALRLAARLAHDMKAPLRIIDGYSNALLEDCTDIGTDGRRYIDTIRSNSARISSMIDGLVLWLRAGSEPLVKSDLDMESMAKEVGAEVLLANPCSEVEYKVEPLPAICADAGLIECVWFQLVANAMKFSRTRHPARIRISGAKVDQKAVFKVTDNGVGFEVSDANRLFDLFERGHSRSEFEGAGAGLAVVRRIVERHGGHAWAESGPGKGATFSFSLPSS
jgi:light-regulated signal transduction histidine kinase (bacteriophytochrome)